MSFLVARKKRTKVMEESPALRRGVRVILAPEWLEVVRRDQRVDGLTLEQLGVVLAKAAGRTKPLDKNMVQRFLSGELATLEVTEAFCAYLGLAPPVAIARTDSEARWFEVGQELRDILPKEFDELLADMAAIAESERRKRAIFDKRRR